MKVATFILALCFGLFTGCAQNDKTEKLNDNIGKDNDIALITPYNGSNQVISNENGIYYTENYVINFYDTKSNLQAPLCNRVECLHNDDTCTAYMDDSLSSLFFSKGQDKLFYNYLDADRNTWVTTSLNLDGSDRKVIDERITNPTTFVNIAGDNEHLYIVSSDITSSEKSDNVFEQKVSIFKINFNTSKSEKVLELDTKQAKIIGAYGRNIIVERSVMSENLKFKFEILSCNMDTLSYETIFEYSYDVTDDTKSNNILFQNGNNFYTLESVETGKASLYKMDAAGGEKTIISNEIPFFGIFEKENINGVFDGHLIIFMREFVRNGAQKDQMKHYAISLETGAVTEIKLNRINETDEIIFDPIKIIDETSTHFIVNYGMDFTLYTFPGQTTASSIGVPKIGLIKKEDYFSSNAQYTPIRYK